jgi:phosphatidylinositol glycan class A protein
MKFTLSGVDRCIAVSHCDRENLVLRASLHADRVTAIPNAADMDCFVPDPTLRARRPTVNVVVISRLAYRKGIDLLAHMIPLACERFPHINFIIGGDGPKRLLLDEMREQHQLHDRVELLGAVEHSQVRKLRKLRCMMLDVNHAW